MVCFLPLTDGACEPVTDKSGVVFCLKDIPVIIFDEDPVPTKLKRFAIYII